MATPNTGNRGRRVTPYVLGWALLALVSMGYLATAALKPDVLQTVIGSSAEAEEEQRIVAETAIAVDENRESISQIQLEIAKIKTDMAAATERDTAISKRIDLLDQRAAEEKAAAETAAAEQKTDGEHEKRRLGNVKVLNSPDLAEAARAPAPKSTENKSAEKKTASKTDKTEKKAATRHDASEIETGSVRKRSSDAVAFGPPVVKAAPKPIGIQIPTGQSIDNLRQSWAALSQRHPGELGSLNARYVVAGRNVDGQTYDLVAGPVRSTAEARRICKELTSQLVPCKVGNFAGNAL